MNDKDSVISAIIPANVGECAMTVDASKGYCISDETVKKIGQIIGVDDDTDDLFAIIAESKEKTGCETEQCVLESLEPKLGQQIVRAEIALHMKIAGPVGTQLLNNTNIDPIMKQWEHARICRLSDGKTRKNKKLFFAYNFNMVDFATNSLQNGYIVNEPDTLVTIPFIDLYKQGYKCAGCVINSDVYSGPGKHWMALFVDTRTKPWTVEFFNSIGNSPAPE